MKNTIGKFVLAFGLVVLGILASTNALAATWSETGNITSDNMAVYADGNIVWHGTCDTVRSVVGRTTWSCNTYQDANPAFERDSMTVRVVFKAASDMSDVKIHAWINGYREDIEATTGTFDIFKGNQYTKTLTLELPADLDAKDDYTLHVEIESKKELKGLHEAEISATVQRASSELKILSSDLWSYTEGFVAGNTLYADVVVKNTGNHLTEDVYYKVSVPALGITRTVYAGDVGSYDGNYEDAVKKTIALTLPDNAKAGEYELVIEAYNSEVSTEDKETFVITDGTAENGTDDATPSTEGSGKISGETIAIVISIVLAVAIIVLLITLLVRQKPNADEKPEAESYY